MRHGPWLVALLLITGCAATVTEETPKPASFPDASTTGVPDGVNLSAYKGPCVITRKNTVIDKKEVTCSLTIETTGVKITNSTLVTVSTDVGTDYSFSITDSSLHAGDGPATGIGSANFTATRVEVVGGNRSVNCYAKCTLIDSYLHGQYTDASGTAHESAVRMGSGAVIRHNTLLCDAKDVPPDGGCSADLTGYGDFDTVHDNLIENNLFKATTGGYCAYGGSSGLANGGKPFPNAYKVRFVNNVFERGKVAGDHGKPVCGAYGPATDFDAAGEGNVWSGNTWDDGSELPAP